MSTAFQRFSVYTRQILVNAVAQARVTGRPQLEVEHLALALLQDTGTASRLLVGLGFDPGRAQAELVSPPQSDATRPDRLPFSAEVNQTLRTAINLAARRNAAYCGSEHLLLALLDSGDERVSRAFTGQGITPAQVVAGLDGPLRRSRERLAERTGLRGWLAWRRLRVAQGAARPLPLRLVATIALVHPHGRRTGRGQLALRRTGRIRPTGD